MSSLFSPMSFSTTSPCCRKLTLRTWLASRSLSRSALASARSLDADTAVFASPPPPLVPTAPGPRDRCAAISSRSFVTAWSLCVRSRRSWVFRWVSCCCTTALVRSSRSSRVATEAASEAASEPRADSSSSAARASATVLALVSVAMAASAAALPASTTATASAQA